MIDPSHPDFDNTPVSPRRPPFAYRPQDRLAPPLVSIVTPYHNSGAIFHETAQSIFNQSLQQFEWLIVNDGSTDGPALKVLDEYRSTDDPRIHVIDLPEKSGPSTARNSGAARARADYIFAIDSDDLIEPTALEKLYWHLVSHPAFDFAHGYSIGFGAQEYLWTHGYRDREGFLKENLATGRTMMRKRVFAHGGYDPEIRGGFED